MFWYMYLFVICRRNVSFLKAGPKIGDEVPLSLATALYCLNSRECRAMHEFDLSRIYVHLSMDESSCGLLKLFPISL